MRGHADDAASHRAVRFQAGRRIAQTRGHGLLAAGDVASLEELECVRGKSSGDGAAVVHRIRRREKLQRRDIFAGRLFNFWPRDGGFAETTFRIAPRKLAAHPDVQRGIAFAEPVELRGAGLVRGTAAAGIQGRDFLDRIYRINRIKFQK